MTTATTNAAEAARALKARHRAMWAAGDYPAVTTDLVSPLGPVLAGACGIRPGDRVLDVAAGDVAMMEDLVAAAVNAGSGQRRVSIHMFILTYSW